jgi:tetratricopeptide (TPR) repeat protein
MRGRRLLILAFGLVALALAAVGVTSSWRYQGELAQARHEMDDRQFRAARTRLTAVQGSVFGRGEAEYRLGICEESLGNPARARAAWLRVPANSAYAGFAELGRAQLAMRSGNLTTAEELLKAALERPGGHRQAARHRLVSILRPQGRPDEIRRLLQEGWHPAVDPTELVRELWKVETEPFPVESVRTYLDEVARSAPDDDRVRVGRANLSIRTGRFAEAQTILEECLVRQPNDAVLWRSWLDWAIAADRPDEARRALGHIPTAFAPETGALGLRAWFARQANERDDERRALTNLANRFPGSSPAWERLAELALEAGDRDLAAKDRERKRHVTQLREKYSTLLSEDDSAKNALALGELAEQLGRDFEARCWATWAQRRRPIDDRPRALLAKLTSRDSPRPAPGQTLADLLADLAPITVAAKSSPPSLALSFVDDADRAGLTFVYNNGRSTERQLPETMGCGVALLDYDGDGWLDVYVVQGGPFPPQAGSLATNHDRLFRNLGQGQFNDVTAEVGLERCKGGYGHGVAVGDYDNDGRPDLFVTRWRSYALYHNTGGRFEDVTEPAGLGGDRDWPTSAAFADFDGDGDLDLYVCHYLKWDSAHPKICTDAKTRQNFYCTPRDFEALPDHLFRNDGGRFVDVSDQAGITAIDKDGRGLGVLAADLDGDGKVDLFVANDMSANFFLFNRGGLRFEDRAQAAGLAANADGGYQAGMGIACGDADGDGRLDLAVTNFYGESTTLFHNLGRGFFADRSAASGIAAVSKYLLGFGASFLDVDADGQLDLATANGHVNDGRPFYPYAMPAQLLLGAGGGRFFDATEAASPAWTLPRVGRGLASGDLDNDGRIDLVLVAQDGPLAYLHNQVSGGHWLGLKLEGTANNRDAIGARVSVLATGRTQVAQRFGGGSYASASDTRLHFGLGKADRVESVTVVWPSGRTDTYRDLPADNYVWLREGRPEFLLQEGARP